jgi:hypothetical protein
MITEFFGQQWIISYVRPYVVLTADITNTTHTHTHIPTSLNPANSIFTKSSSYVWATPFLSAHQQSHLTSTNKRWFILFPSSAWSHITWSRINPADPHICIFCHSGNRRQHMNLKQQFKLMECKFDSQNFRLLKSISLKKKCIFVGGKIC